MFRKEAFVTLLPVFILAVGLLLAIGLRVVLVGVVSLVVGGSCRVE
jgi:hypothetical protein